MARDTSNTTPIERFDDLVAYLAAGCRPCEDWKIGTEHEKLVFYTDGNRPVPYEGPAGIRVLLEGMQDKLGWEPIVDGNNIIGLASPIGRGAISLEPGGQFELSGAPLETIHQTCRESNVHLSQLRQIAEPLGIRFLGMGASPKWTLEQTPMMPKSRYQIMASYMPEVGTQGHDMMFRTCTIQTNLDFSSEADMRHKMQVGMKLQPLATALFASSPFTEGEPNGLLSWRGDIWRDVDNNRAGILPFTFAADFGFADYAEWALDVPMYFVMREGHYHRATHVTFRQFLDGALSQRHSRSTPQSRRLDKPSLHPLPGRPPEAVPGDARRGWRTVAAHLRAAGVLGRASLRRGRAGRVPGLDGRLDGGRGAGDARHRAGKSAGDGVPRRHGPRSRLSGAADRP